MTEVAKVESLAVQRRRESCREEWNEQTKLAALLREHLDPARTYWTALENKPLSPMSGVFQRRRGVKAGIPDVEVIFRQPAGSVIVFVELKSRRGVASEAQKQARAEMLPAGAVWWMARSAGGGDDGVTPFGRAVSQAVAAAAARTVGGAVCRPASAMAARADGGGRASGDATGLA